MILSSAVKQMGEKVRNAEIAFFGGSFTAIERNYMISLLKVASRFVEEYGFIGIRCSTRPDKIDDETLYILKKYKVSSIELGAQSMCNEVLLRNDRGHTAEDVISASKLIKCYGFELGLQMMTGLYGSDKHKDIQTAESIITLQPDTVRIYPTLTLENTKLADLYRDGTYIPPSLEDSVELCSELITMFNNHNINIIRVGLHDSDTFNYSLVAGPYHPAFRELCESRIILNDILQTSRNSQKTNILITTNPKFLSKVLGQKRSNISTLNKLGYSCKISVDSGIEKYTIGNY